MTTHYTPGRPPIINHTSPLFLSQAESTINSILPLFTLLDQINEYTTFNIPHTPSHQSQISSTFLTYPPLVQFISALDKYTTFSPDFPDFPHPNALLAASDITLLTDITKTKASTTQFSHKTDSENIPVSSCKMKTLSTPLNRIINLFSTHQSTFFYYDDDKQWHTKTHPFDHTSRVLERNIKTNETNETTITTPLCTPICPLSSNASKSKSKSPLSSSATTQPTAIESPQIETTHIDSNTDSVDQATTTIHTNDYWTPLLTHLGQLHHVLLRKRFFFLFYLHQICVPSFVSPDIHIDIFTNQLQHNISQDKERKHLLSIFDYGPLDSIHLFDIISFFYQQYSIEVKFHREEQQFTSYPYSTPPPSTLLALHATHSSHTKLRHLQYISNHSNPYGIILDEDINFLNHNKAYTTHINSYLSTQLDWGSFLLTLTLFLTHILPLTSFSIPPPHARHNEHIQRNSEQSRKAQVSIENNNNTSATSLTHSSSPPSLLSSQRRLSVFSAFIQERIVHELQYTISPFQFLPIGYLLSRVILFDSSYTSLTLATITSQLNQQMISMQLSLPPTMTGNTSSSSHLSTLSTTHTLQSDNNDHLQQYLIQSWLQNVNLIQEHIQQQSNTVSLHTQTHQHRLYYQQNNPNDHYNSTTYHNTTQLDLPTTNQLYILNYYLLLFYPTLRVIDTIFQVYFQTSFISSMFLRPTFPSNSNSTPFPSQSQQHHHHQPHQQHQKQHTNTIQTYIIQSISLLHLYDALFYTYSSILISYRRSQSLPNVLQFIDMRYPEGTSMLTQDEKDTIIQIDQIDQIGSFIDPAGFPYTHIYHDITVNLLLLINDDRFSQFIQHTFTRYHSTLNNKPQHNFLSTFFPSSLVPLDHIETGTNDYINHDITRNDPNYDQNDPKCQILCTCCSFSDFPTLTTSLNDPISKTALPEGNNLYLHDLEQLHELILKFITPSQSSVQSTTLPHPTHQLPNLSPQNELKHHQSNLRSVAASLQRSQRPQSYMTQHIINLFVLSLNMAQSQAYLSPLFTQSPPESTTNPLSTTSPLSSKSPQDLPHPHPSALTSTDSTSSFPSTIIAPTQKDVISNPQYNPSAHLQRIVNTLSLLLHISLPEQAHIEDQLPTLPSQPDAIQSSAPDLPYKDNVLDIILDHASSQDDTDDAISSQTKQQLVDEITRLKDKLKMKEESVALFKDERIQLTKEITVLKSTQAHHLFSTTGVGAGIGAGGHLVNQSQSTHQLRNPDTSSSTDPNLSLSQLQTYFMTSFFALRQKYLQKHQIYGFIQFQTIKPKESVNIYPVFNNLLNIPGAIGYVHLQHNRILKELFPHQPAQFYNTIPYIAMDHMEGKQECPLWIKTYNNTLLERQHNFMPPRYPLLDEHGYYQIYACQTTISSQPNSTTSKPMKKIHYVPVYALFQPFSPQMLSNMHLSHTADIANIQIDNSGRFGHNDTLTNHHQNDVSNNTNRLPSHPNYNHIHHSAIAPHILSSLGQSQLHNNTDYGTSRDDFGSLPSASQAGHYYHPHTLPHQLSSKSKGTKGSMFLTQQILAANEHSQLLTQLFDRTTKTISYTPLDLFPRPITTSSNKNTNNNTMLSRIEILTELQNTIAETPSSYHNHTMFPETPPQSTLLSKPSSSPSYSTSLQFTEEQYLFYLHYLLNGYQYKLCKPIEIDDNDEHNDHRDSTNNNNKEHEKRIDNNPIISSSGGQNQFDSNNNSNVAANNIDPPPLLTQYFSDASNKSLLYTFVLTALRSISSYTVHQTVSINFDDETCEIQTPQNYSRDPKKAVGLVLTYSRYHEPTAPTTASALSGNVLQLVPPPVSLSDNAQSREIIAALVGVIVAQESKTMGYWGEKDKRGKNTQNGSSNAPIGIPFSEYSYDVINTIHPQYIHSVSR